MFGFEPTTENFDGLRDCAALDKTFDLSAAQPHTQLRLQARLERMPGDGLLARATGLDAKVSLPLLVQCVRDRLLGPATKADAFAQYAAG